MDYMTLGLTLLRLLNMRRYQGICYFSITSFIKIPSEMEVAPQHKLLTLLAMFTMFTLLKHGFHHFRCLHCSAYTAY